MEQEDQIDVSMTGVESPERDQGGYKYLYYELRYMHQNILEPFRNFQNIPELSRCLESIPRSSTSYTMICRSSKSHTMLISRWLSMTYCWCGVASSILTMKDFYEHCRHRKQTQTLQSLYYETVHRPLELVHIDICGPMPERSLGGPRYFITFVDDCTQTVWACSIRFKDEAFEVFSRWLAEVEN